VTPLPSLSRPSRASLKREASSGGDLHLWELFLALFDRHLVIASELQVYLLPNGAARAVLSRNSGRRKAPLRRKNAPGSLRGPCAAVRIRTTAPRQGAPWADGRTGHLTSVLWPRRAGPRAGPVMSLGRSHPDLRHRFQRFPCADYLFRGVLQHPQCRHCPAGPRREAVAPRRVPEGAERCLAVRPQCHHPPRLLQFRRVVTGITLQIGQQQCRPIGLAGGSCQRRRLSCCRSRSVQMAATIQEQHLTPPHLSIQVQGSRWVPRLQCLALLVHGQPRLDAILPSVPSRALGRTAARWAGDHARREWDL
jgi:hypothetical protein